MTRLTVLMLAAGRSRRFGEGDKLMAGLRGRPLIDHAIAAQSHIVAQRVAVVGPDGAAGDLLSAAGFRLVVNPAPDDGQGRSLALGVAQVAGGRVLVLLGDMPFLTPELLTRVASHECRAVASDGVRRSPPALFPGSDRAVLLGATGDRGAHAVLAAAELVPATPDELRDIDTPEALRAANAGFGVPS